MLADRYRAVGFTNVFKDNLQHLIVHTIAKSTACNNSCVLLVYGQISSEFGEAA
jgi:hypothetical protein